MKKSILMILGAASAAALLARPPVATASLDTQKKARAAGFPAANCTYCHVEKLPKKGATTPNERGKFLVTEKEKKGAKEIDVNWLKDYKEEKK